MMGACGGGGTDWDCAGAGWAPPFTTKGVGGTPALWLLLLLLLVGGEGVVMVGVGRNRVPPDAW